MFGSTTHNHQLKTNSFMKIIFLLIIGFAAAAIAMPATSPQPVLAIDEPHTQEQPFEIEEPEKFENMPSLIYKDYETFWAYVLPPIKYPNNKMYIKVIGMSYILMRVLTTVRWTIQNNQQQVCSDISHRLL